MQRISVDSSNIVSVGYDKNRKILQVEFHGEAVYEYLDVPENVYNELMDASSHGIYFSSHIRNIYSHRRA